MKASGQKLPRRRLRQIAFQARLERAVAAFRPADRCLVVAQIDDDIVEALRIPCRGNEAAGIRRCETGNRAVDDFDVGDILKDAKEFCRIAGLADANAAGARVSPRISDSTRQTKLSRQRLTSERFGAVTQLISR